MTFVDRIDAEIRRQIDAGEHDGVGEHDRRHDHGAALAAMRKARVRPVTRRTRARHLAELSAHVAMFNYFYHHGVRLPSNAAASHDHSGRAEIEGAAKWLLATKPGAYGSINALVLRVQEKLRRARLSATIKRRMPSCSTIKRVIAEQHPELRKYARATKNP